MHDRNANPRADRSGIVAHAPHLAMPDDAYTRSALRRAEHLGQEADGHEARESLAHFRRVRSASASADATCHNK